MSDPTSDRIRRWFDGYKTAAVVFCNTVLLFLALNLLFFLIGRVNEETPGQWVIKKYGFETLRRAHPKLTDVEIITLQEETWGRRLTYEPFTEFKEAEFQGHHLNISPAGFRLGPSHEAWPPNEDHLNIFIFGGSTTFGYGVADTDTLPAQLQVRLRAMVPKKLACVYNFGRGFFASTQERILFQQLLMQGQRPAIAVFVDGINDAVFLANESALSADLEQAVKRKNAQASDLGLLARLPLLRPVDRLLADDTAPNRRMQELGRELGIGGSVPSFEQLVSWVGARYLANARLSTATGREFGVRTLFIWQPCPFYKFDPARLHFPLSPQDQFVRAAYERMASRNSKELPEHFLWLADGQESLNEPLYVDALHYSPHFTALLASRIADWLKANGWVD